VMPMLLDPASTPTDLARTLPSRRAGSSTLTAKKLPPIGSPVKRSKLDWQSLEPFRGPAAVPEWDPANSPSHKSPPAGFRKASQYRRKLPSAFHGDVECLLEAFIAHQKRLSGQWRPTRQAKLAPVKTMKRSLRIQHQSEAAAESHDYFVMTAGLVGVGSQRFPVGDAPSFEAVLQAFFRTASEEELDMMVQYAEPLIAWRRREFERRSWVEQAHARLGRMAQYAFTEPAAMAYGVREGKADLSIDSFAEAVALHRKGVDPDSLSIPGLRNMQAMAGINRMQIAAADPRIAEIVEAAGEDGSMNLDDLLTHVSWEPTLSDAFEAIVRIGSAKRDNLKNGYWRKTVPKSVQEPRRQLRPPQQADYARRPQLRTMHRSMSLVMAS